MLHQIYLEQDINAVNKNSKNIMIKINKLEKDNSRILAKLNDLKNSSDGAIGLFEDSKDLINSVQDIFNISLYIAMPNSTFLEPVLISTLV